jgi:ppGpp synthetase/RelA/SpoT-type nucleotidyltranferase
MTILDDYDSAAVFYEAFTNKLEVLIKDIIRIDGLKVHAVSSRLKERPSLESKIVNNIDKYTALSQITDLSGIRIITTAYARATGASKCCVQNENRGIKSSPSRCAG